MELSKKTTILMSPALHEQLMRVSKETGKSMGELIREACEQRYGGRRTQAEKLAALEALFQLNLPVADVATMKAESIEEPEPLPGWKPE